MSAVSPVSDKSGTRSSDSEVKQVFQEFAAGTFYREMLSALRKGTGKPAYFHGGYAEDVFRAEMDRHIVDDLAAKHGASLIEPMYESFASQVLSGSRR